jgi:hypothetical protein
VSCGTVHDCPPTPCKSKCGSTDGQAAGMAGRGRRRHASLRQSIRKPPQLRPVIERAGANAIAVSFQWRLMGLVGRLQAGAVGMPPRGVVSSTGGLRRGWPCGEVYPISEHAPGADCRRRLAPGMAESQSRSHAPRAFGTPYTSHRGVECVADSRLDLRLERVNVYHRHRR